MILATLVSMAVLGCNNANVVTASATAPKNPTSIYDFKMNDIDGHEVALDKFKGKVLLVVNVASQCGFTPQYTGLEALYNKYHDQGFEILGFPANDFGQQEPGTNEEIKQFCTSKFNVTFPMFSKITVLGDNAHPLYKWLIASADRHNPIEWNFTKFLVDKQGHVIGRWKSQTTPDSPELTSAIETALKA
jgi:glutathione peroxidase